LNKRHFYLITSVLLDRELSALIGQHNLARAARNQSQSEQESGVTHSNTTKKYFTAQLQMAHNFWHFFNKIIRDFFLHENDKIANNIPDEKSC